MNKEAYKPYEEKMKKTITVLKEDLSTLRAGRANPHILDRIMVDYYGVPTPINQLGNINVPEARLVTIQPWDMKLLKDIEKAIQKSDIGINPNNDGRIIRLVFPELTEERRKELVKVIKKKGEDAKIAVRSIRRDAMEHFKTLKKDARMSEDELKIAEKDIQVMTDKQIEEIDKIIEAKDKEILEV